MHIVFSKLVLQLWHQEFTFIALLGCGFWMVCDEEGSVDTIAICSKTLLLYYKLDPNNVIWNTMLVDQILCEVLDTGTDQGTTDRQRQIYE